MSAPDFTKPQRYSARVRRWRIFLLGALVGGLIVWSLPRLFQPRMGGHSQIAADQIDAKIVQFLKEKGQLDAAAVDRYEQVLNENKELRALCEEVRPLVLEYFGARDRLKEFYARHPELTK